MNKFGVFMLLVSCISVTTALPPCVCTRNFKPVCGSDGITYSNECMLECQNTKTPGITLARNGQCETSNNCICTLEYKPVCGSDGVTYPNQCTFKCERNAATEIVSSGPCRQKRDAVKVVPLPSCQCTKEGHPVCGSDGNTYQNPCLLNCIKEFNQDLHIEHSGRCEKDVKGPQPGSSSGCTCGRNLQPVCASNGVTYSNICLMKCAGEDLTVERDAPCEV